MKTFPLSQSQLGIFLECIQHPEATQYNLPFVTRLSNKVSADRLCNAINIVLHTDDVFYTKIVEQDGDYRQYADKQMQIDLPIIDVDEKKVNKCIQQFIRPFDLLNDSLTRIELIRTTNALYFLLDMHHIITDCFSAMKIFDDIDKAYNGKRLAIHANLLYDYAEKEMHNLENNDYLKSALYYKDLFKETFMSAFPEKQNEGLDTCKQISSYLSRERINNFCQINNIKPNLLFMSAFELVLSRLTRETKVAYSTTYHGRNNIDCRETIGMFVKTIPFSIEVIEDLNVLDFIHSHEKLWKQAKEHIAYPFTHFCRDLKQTSEIIFSFQGSLIKMENNFIGENVIHEQYSEGTTINSTVIQIYENIDDFEIRIRYGLAQYPKGEMNGIADAIRSCIINFIENEKCRLSDISLILNSEKDNLQKSVQKGHDTFIDIFVKQVKTNPDATAVVFKKKKITYRELDDITTRLAAYLQFHYSVGRESIVGIMIDRSELMVIYPLAILKAGGAYMPLDYKFPSDRLMFMCEDAGVKLILSEDRRVNDVIPNYKYEILNSDIISVLPNEYKLKESQKATSENLFVLLYTSGSTGKPKGCMLENRGIVNYCYWYVSEFNISSQDHTLAYANFGFDMHMSDIYPALSAGACIYIVPSEMIFDLQVMNEYMEENSISVAFMTTQLGYMFASTIDNHSLRLLLVAGEKLPTMKKPSYSFYNGYGPTECSMLSTFYKIEDEYCDGSIIGRPLPNYQLRVVDSMMHSLPKGISGELIVMGDGVARGYLNRPKLTKEKFLIIDGQKAYRTGDLVKWTDGGNIEYIGRIDGQVKLRGLRIELGEIETTLSKYPGIKRTCVTIKDIEGTQHLCAYYTSDEYILNNDIITFLNQSLAKFMIPDFLIRICEFPLTPNGKINRNALPDPEIKVNEIIPPDTELERNIFNITAMILKHSKFGVTTNLISVGLNSLLAMQLSITISKELNMCVSTKDILSKTTIRQLATVASTQSVVVNNWDKRVHYPITESQRGVFIDWEMHRDTTQYNIPTIIRMKNADTEKLRNALLTVVEAHPYLKMQFRMEDGDIKQIRNDTVPVTINIEDMDIEPDTAFFQNLVRPFNLLEEKLYRLEIYKSRSCVYLFMDFHHTIFDGLSLNIFMKDLKKAIGGTSLDRETYSAYDYSLDEQQILKSARYNEAEQYFNSLLDHTEVTVYPRSSNPQGKGAEQLYVDVPRASIDIFCRTNGLTASNFFMSSLIQVLHRVTREDTILITTVNNGRSDNRMAHTIGMLVKTLPVVSTLREDRFAELSIVDVMLDLQRQFLETQSRDFYPYTKMVEHHSIHPEIMYVFQGGLYEWQSENIESINLTLDTAKFPINLIVYPTDDKSYRIMLEYDKSLYSESDMETLISMLKIISESEISVENVLELSLVGKTEIKKLLKISEGPKLYYDRHITFLDMFLQQVTVRPNSIAIFDEVSSISYGELNRYSDILATILINKKIDKDSFVCIMLPRRKEFLTSVISVFKAGGAYVPIDSEYPSERINYMLEDSESQVLITTRKLYKEKNNLGNFDQEKILFVDDVDWNTSSKPINNSSPQNLAYMIYTSGSTGKPKGVMIEQKSLSSFLAWQVLNYVLKPNEQCGGYASFGFDASISELYCPLIQGATLHIVPSSIRHDMDGIFHFIIDNDIIGMYLSTQLGMEMVNAYDLPLKYLIVGGEQLKPTRKTSVNILNYYGPTEFTVCSSFHVLDNSREYTNVPIGRPVPNSYSVIVDKCDHLLPEGVMGELCLIGSQMSCGYWKHDNLNKNTFVKCPFFPNKYMYKTGDLVKWNKKNELEYIGRIDTQVKLRGFRIELGEIEICASSFSGNMKSVAAEVKTINSIQRLCLYYTSIAEIDESKLKSYMSQSLPEYMVPEIIVKLNNMPVTPNGKINRKILPIPNIAIETEIIVPSNVKEQILFKLVSELLGSKDFGVTDDLKSLGLTSLLAMKLTGMANNLGIILKAGDVMRKNTIRTILDGEHHVCYWTSPYQKEKPVVVLFYFLTPYNMLVPLRDKLSERFSVLVVESIADHFDDLFKGKNLNDVIEEYSTLIGHYLKTENNIHAFIGHCLAGEIAFRMSALWQKKTHKMIPVVMLNTNGFEFHRDNGYEEYLNNLPGEFKMRHQKELEWKLRDRNIVTSLINDEKPPFFSGHVLYYKALRKSPLFFEKELIEDNELDVLKKLQDKVCPAEDYLSYWKQYALNMESKDVAAEHFEMLGKDFVDIYVDDITKL